MPTSAVFIINHPIHYINKYSENSQETNTDQSMPQEIVFRNSCLANFM